MGDNESEPGILADLRAFEVALEGEFIAEGHAPSLAEAQRRALAFAAGMAASEQSGDMSPLNQMETDR